MTDMDWLRQACLAATMSHDPDTWVGAVLVPAGGDIAMAAAAANRVPRGVSGPLTRPEKYRIILHAEQEAVAIAASRGWPTAGSTLYGTWIACPDCAKVLIVAGVRRCVTPAVPQACLESPWAAEVEIGVRMLLEAGVAVDRVLEPVGLPCRIRGQEVLL